MADSEDVYTHGHHPSVLRSRTWRTAEISAGYLLAHLTPSMRMLDVDCGPATAETWRRWMNDPAAWFTVPNGELLIRC